MLDNARKRLAENLTFMVTARLAMVACAAILPVAVSLGGYFGSKGLEIGARALQAISRLEMRQELLEQSLRLQLEAGSHEREQLRLAIDRQDGRIRGLELGSLDRPVRDR